MQQQGLYIDTATTGAEAMAHLQRRDYDLCLFDMHLPDLSGYALCSWYREMCRNQGRSAGFVVAVTADPDEKACREFGIDQCLGKPLSSSGIVAMLTQLWGAKGALSPPPTKNLASATPRGVAAGWGHRGGATAMAAALPPGRAATAAVGQIPPFGGASSGPTGHVMSDVPTSAPNPNGPIPVRLCPLPPPLPEQPAQPPSRPPPPTRWSPTIPPQSPARVSAERAVRAGVSGSPRHATSDADPAPLPPFLLEPGVLGSSFLSQQPPPRRDPFAPQGAPMDIE